MPWVANLPDGMRRNFGMVGKYNCRSHLKHWQRWDAEATAAQPAKPLRRCRLRESSDG